MDSLLEGFNRALFLIFNLDTELLGIIFLSLKVSGLALIISTLAGLPVGTLIGFKKFPGAASCGYRSVYVRGDYC
jgi:tungstate transport system permease protein